MKKYILTSFLLLYGCSHISTDITPLKYNEVLGYGYEKFENRIFSATCHGDEYIGKKEINKECLTEMSKTAFNSGYQYFTVVFQEGEKTSSLRSYETTTAVPSNRRGMGPIIIPQTNIYTATEYTKYYGFILINHDELSNWNNYYKVSDYYNPNQN